MKYIRTKDGKIIDLQKFIEKEKENPYYTDYEFEEIKNEEDCCSIHWTAIGTKQNSQEEQIGRRCQFSASVNSPFIKQADTIEKLCDEFVIGRFYTEKLDSLMRFIACGKEQGLAPYTAKIYGAIWTEWGLKYVAKMNDKGELELL